MCGELLQKIFEQPSGNGVQAGERFVEDQQPRIVQQGSRQQHSLLHAFGVKRDGRVAPALQVEKSEQLVGLVFDQVFGQVAQPADQLQILQRREVGIDMCFLGDVAKCGSVSL